MMGRGTSPFPSRIPFPDFIVNIKGGMSMKIFALALHITELVFYAAVIIYIVRRWNK